MPKRDETPEIELVIKPSAKLDASVRKLRFRHTIARAVLEARLKAGWTQTELARSSSTKQAKISEIENGRGNPTLDTIERVFSTLGLDLEASQFKQPGQRTKRPRQSPWIDAETAKSHETISLPQQGQSIEAIKPGSRVYTRPISRLRLVKEA